MVRLRPPHPENQNAYFTILASQGFSGRPTPQGRAMTGRASQCQSGVASGSPGRLGPAGVKQGDPYVTIYGPHMTIYGTHMASDGAIYGQDEHKTVPRWTMEGANSTKTGLTWH